MNEKKNVMGEIAVIAQHPDYRMEIADVLRSSLTPKRMRERLLNYHENDIAAALELLKKDERLRLYSILGTDTLSGVLEYAGLKYLGELSIRKRVEILAQVEVSTAVEYLQQLPKAERNVLIELMDEDVRREITLLSSFDEDEIGSRMTTNYVFVRHGVSVREAMRALIEQAADNDNIATIYVVDEEGVFVGAIDLKDLIIAREGTSLESIAMSSYPYVYASELILGALSVACIGAYLVVLKGQPAVMAFSVSLCTGAALLLSILLSSVCGTVVPLAFKKMNVDPAVASGPLITTINDLVAVVSYYGLAWLLLIRVLHL